MSSQWQRWRGIMKCMPFEEKRLNTWAPPYIVQPKYDGVRCRAVPIGEGNYILLSSEENVIFGTPHIIEELNKFGQSIGYPELDGELYCHGMSFEGIIGITSREVNIRSNYKVIEFHIFDVIDKQNQIERQIFLSKIDTSSASHIVISPFWVCASLDSIMKVYDIIIDLGYEGIIVRNINSFYERKRSTNVMKLKPKKHDIYKIVSVKEEISKDGIPKNSLGALVCDSGDGNTFNVGTGFTEEQRQQIWKDREEIVGKSVMVGYQHLTSGMKVPRFPVFMEVV